jgi:hypothetical protein
MGIDSGSRTPLFALALAGAGLFAHGGLYPTVGHCQEAKQGEASGGQQTDQPPSDAKQDQGGTKTPGTFEGTRGTTTGPYSATASAAVRWSADPPLKLAYDYIAALRKGTSGKAKKALGLRSDHDLMGLASRMVTRFRKIQQDLQQYDELIGKHLRVGTRTAFLGEAYLYAPLETLVPYVRDQAQRQLLQDALAKAKKAGLKGRTVQALLHPVHYCLSLNKQRVVRLFFGDRVDELVTGQGDPRDAQVPAHFRDGFYRALVRKGTLDTSKLVQWEPWDNETGNASRDALRKRLGQLIALRGLGKTADICGQGGASYLEPELVIRGPNGLLDPTREPLVIYNKEHSVFSFFSAVMLASSDVADQLAAGSLSRPDRYLTLTSDQQLTFVSTLMAAAGADGFPTSRALAEVLFHNVQDPHRMEQALAWFERTLARTVDHSWLNQGLPLDEMADLALLFEKRTVTMLLKTLFAAALRHRDPSRHLARYQSILDTALTVHPSRELLERHVDSEYRTLSGLLPGSNFQVTNGVRIFKPEAFHPMVDSNGYHSGPFVYAYQYARSGRITDQTPSHWVNRQSGATQDQILDEAHLGHDLAPGKKPYRATLDRQYFLAKQGDPSAAMVAGCSGTECPALVVDGATSRDLSLDHQLHFGLAERGSSLGPHDLEPYRVRPPASLGNMGGPTDIFDPATYRRVFRSDGSFDQIWSSGEILFVPMPTFELSQDLIAAVGERWRRYQGGTLTASQEAFVIGLADTLLLKLRQARAMSQLSAKQQTYLDRLLATVPTELARALYGNAGGSK